MKCLTPFFIRDKITLEHIQLPCGKCEPCLKRRVSGWSFRLRQQDKMSQSSNFITLTYNTDKVPITKNGFMTLKKRDIQLFMKRLRKLQKSKGNNDKITYYICGEYGGKGLRPHYHAIMFNADVNLVEQAWQNGSIHNGDVSEASVGYTLKYMCKPPQIPKHRNDDRLPEFSLMSKGIGKNYITENMTKWHKNDLLNRMYIPIEDGKKIAMPRYFKDKMYTEQERKQIGKHMCELNVDNLDLTDDKKIIDLLQQSNARFKRLNEKL